MNTLMPNAEDLRFLNMALQRISPLTDDDLARLTTLKLICPKGNLLLRAGDQAHQSAFVINGALREYYLLADGTERTRSFNLSGDFAGSLSDLLSGQPSHLWISAEADTTLLIIDWAAYQRLVNTHSAWAMFAGKLAERLYLQKVEREYELLALDAKTRYQRSLLRWPNLEKLYTQKDIASYIGITPVHLSRLKASL